MVLFDIVSGIVNGYLFIRPIYKLRSLSHVNDKLRYIARKQRVLSITAIVSSIVANFGLAIIDMPQFSAGFDIVISTTCILLMYSWNEEIYQKLCCCFIHPSSMQKNMESEITSSKTSRKNTNTAVTVNTASSSALESTVTTNTNTNSPEPDLVKVSSNTMDTN